MAEEPPEEFNCEMDPGVGLLLDGFTAGFDLMIEPFQVALAVALDPVNFAPPFVDIEIIEIGLKVPLLPGIAVPDMNLKFAGKLPGFGLPLPEIPSIPGIEIPAFDPTVTIDFTLALLAVPFDLLMMALDLNPPDLAVDLPRLIAEIPGLDINAAINLSGCVMGIVEGKFPLEPFDPGAKEEEEEEEEEEVEE
ncbi:MAG TPA: hypothetical protein EYG51_18625 [Pseudomonadales bacterium]|nr:hypothetical protein [Rhodospirillales bacterium]HIL97903.1 hypothetical protein [Pseudomonadales bacterium]